MIPLQDVDHREDAHAFRDRAYRLERSRVVEFRANKPFVERTITRTKSDATLLLGDDHHSMDPQCHFVRWHLSNNALLHLGSDFITEGNSERFGYRAGATNLNWDDAFFENEMKWGAGHNPAKRYQIPGKILSLGTKGRLLSARPTAVEGASTILC